MITILPQQAQLLYDKRQETLHQEGLTERERIPAYRRILEKLYRALSADGKRYFGSLGARGSSIPFICIVARKRLASNEAGVDRKLNVAITRAREHLVMMGVREVVGRVLFNTGATTQSFVKPVIALIDKK